MKIATWNVNSIRKRLDRVIAWLGEHRPDILCVQETKVEDGTFPRAELEAAGYQVLCHGQKTYNGVALLGREPLRNPVRGFGDEGESGQGVQGVIDGQARFLLAEVGDVKVGTVYVPNGQAVGSEKFRYKLEWLARWRRWLASNVDPTTPVVLCGDLNVAMEDRDVHDPAAWKDKVLCHPDERAALTEVCNWGLTDAFRLHNQDAGQFTWWDYRQLCFPKNLGLRIDFILCSAPLAARCRSVTIDRNARKGKEPSDHAPVIAEFD
jgi:exodeoxyribonuclease-3